MAVTKSEIVKEYSDTYTNLNGSFLALTCWRDLEEFHEAVMTWQNAPDSKVTGEMGVPYRSRR